MSRFFSSGIILLLFLFGFCSTVYWIMGLLVSTKLTPDISRDKEIQTMANTSEYALHTRYVLHTRGVNGLSCLMVSTKLTPDISRDLMYNDTEFQTSLMVSTKPTPDISRDMMYNDTEIQTTEPSDVLILTYMRCGSKFIGKLLGWRNDVFYWYEPFHEMRFQYFSESGQSCSYGKPYCRNVSETGPKSLERALNLLLDIYKCNNLMQYFPTEEMQISKHFAGPSGEVYSDCRSSVRRNCQMCKKTLVNCKNCTSYAEKCKSCSDQSFKPCYERFINRCPNSQHKVTKVLRMATANAKYLLSQHKRLKLIQVFRDPRGTLNSRMNTGWYYGRIYKRNILSQDIVTLCKRMEEDIAAAQELKRLFPDRVKILQYEDFNDPFRLGKLLYSFLNMRLTRTARSLITELSATGSDQGFHPDSFRYQLNWTTVQDIDKACNKVLESLGLWIFKSEEEFLNTSLDILSGSRPYTIEG